MKTGVLGGTFDPPHLAHLVLAAAARRALDLDRVLFVPAGDPWRKSARCVSAVATRVRMVQAAVEPFSWADGSMVEVERSGPSYSSNTMAELARGGGRWWFILGEDALDDLPHWYEPVELISVARLALARRALHAIQVPEAVSRAVPGIEGRIDSVPMPALNISSTALRQRVRDGRPTEVLLPDAVRQVIDGAGLYHEGSD